MEAHLPALDRVVEKYRHDVHRLRPGATADAVDRLQRHLGVPLPAGHARFLGLHNGAALFRGALRVRGTSEVTVAHEGSPIVLFADAGGSEESSVTWAWVSYGAAPARYVFGRWTGGRLEARYASFSAFLAGEIAALEASDDRDAARVDAAVHDPWQLVQAARRALATSDATAALAWLERARQADPHGPAVYRWLGRARLAAGQPEAAADAWVEALNRTVVPVQWPGAGLLEPDTIQAIAEAEPDGWQESLDAFLDERVDAVSSDDEGALVEAATLARVAPLERRFARDEACAQLEALLARAREADHSWTPWRALLRLVDLNVGAGRHDDAEALLRKLRRDGPASLQADRLVRVLALVVQRQEPWAEDVVRELDACTLAPVDDARVRLLRIERAVRLQQVEEAVALVATFDGAPLDDSELLAGIAMARADVAALRGDLDAAERGYLDALHALDDAPRHELTLRVRLRLAELYRRRGDLEAAHELGAEVVRGFAEMNLPVREAWALVRLARVVAESSPREPEAAEQARRLRHAARERFVQADLAAGVAATDSLAGQPGASLDWHLERSSAQAKARHHAQRSRPPYTRADADRPERRLGAHRLAVAACDDGIVRALAQQLDQCVRASRTSSGRPTEPAVLRYVAAVDLLSGHRSYDAAQVLLDHLLTRGLDGPMHRALRGAIARSPNAALVDGLLRCVEAPRQASPVSIAAAAEVLGMRREPAALDPLVRILDMSGAGAARKAALVALGRIGDRGVVDALVPSLDDARLAEPAALSLLMLGDRRGVDFHGAALVEQRNDLSGSPGEIVGRYGGPDHLLLLIRAIEGDGPRALGALQGLGLLGDPRAVRALLRAMRAPVRKVVEVASGAMQILTGHEVDPTEAGVRGRWTTWWKQHGDRFTEGVRHRRGQVFDCGLLVGDMSHHDAYVRRTAYDELVIASGTTLPFDADGPWRVQRAHLRAWEAWWSTARHLQPGRWYLDGTAVG